MVIISSCLQYKQFNIWLSNQSS
uniref:Uncharacterized protein n=1 Tax=Tetranychus urticae TaxID=32264 RepID=T1K766_TETUR